VAAAPTEGLLAVAPKGVELGEQFREVEFLVAAQLAEQDNQFVVLQPGVAVAQQQIFGGAEVALAEINGAEVLRVEKGGAVFASVHSLAGVEGFVQDRRRFVVAPLRAVGLGEIGH